MTDRPDEDDELFADEEDDSDDEADDGDGDDGAINDVARKRAMNGGAAAADARKSGDARGTSRTTAAAQGDDPGADDEQDAIEQIEELIEYVAHHLVDNKDAVEIQTVEGDRATVFELTVADEDLGKVIGRDGRTARALRVLLAASGAKLQKRAVLDILE